MATTNVAKIIFVGDNASLAKVTADTEKRMKGVSAQTKKTNKDVGGLGASFSQAANNVAIFNGQLDPISGRLSAIGSGISRFGVANIALTAIISGLTIGVGKSIAALESYEQRQNRFEAVLAATGHSARLTRKEFEDLAQVTARNTLGNVSEMSDAIVALTTFRNIQGDVFKQTIALGADARVAFGGNLREGVVAFGKALNDPISNLGALSRKGIQFTDAQKEMIDSLVESGDLLSAQKIILGELQDQFGGLASKEAPALKSQMDSLSQSIDNMFEGLGNTDSAKLFRDVLVQMANGADKAAQSIADLHSEEAIEARQFEELTVAKNQALIALIATQNKLNELQRSASPSLVDLNKTVANVERLQTAYNNAAFSLRNYNDQQKASKLQTEQEAGKGLIKTLSGELSAVEQSNKALADKLNERRVSLVSSFEDEKDKVDRVFQTKSKAYEKSYNEALKSSENVEKAQVKLIEQGITNRNIALDKEILNIESNFRLKRKLAEDESEIAQFEIERLDEIRKVSLQTIEKNNDARAEIEKVKLETIKKNKALEKQYDEDEIKAKLAHEAKLAEIDRKRAAKAEADANRERRAIEIARNAARQREKFLNEITAGSSKKAELKFKYQDDVEALATAEFTKIEIAAAGYETRAELISAYITKLKANYDEDVKNFEEAEASKEQRALERAAKESGRDFLQANETAQLGLDKQDTGVESFFGVDINAQAEQFAALEAATAEHLQRITDMKISAEEKQARHGEVVSKFAIQQAKISAEGRAKAEGDVWSAIGTLGANGSKKAFKIAKAMNIAKAGMNTYVAVTNALANIPAPFNYAAAGLIGVAGAIEINKIRNQQPPQFHDGIDSVPREGTYLLDQGERVLDSRLNKDLKDYLRTGEAGGGGNSPTINFQVDATDVTGFDRWYANNRQSLINDIAYGMERR